MNQAVINGELNVSWPDGFQELSREDLKKLYLDDNPDRWGIRNESKHCVFSVFYHKANPLLSILASDVKEIAEATEKKLRAGYRGHDYRLEGFHSRRIAGLPAEGFRYTYVLNRIEESCETYIMKKGRVTYTVYWYTRKEREAGNQPLLEDLLNSLKF